MAAGTRRRRTARGTITFVLVAAVLAVGGYLVYVGVVGSDLLVHPTRSVWCFTPGSEFGWSYEAINYDIADDERLVASDVDLRRCTTELDPPGDDVVTSDGVRVAGWYIPAAGDIGPSGPTVVLVHGHNNSKSDMLGYAAVLHDEYNTVLVDLRNHGRSTGTLTTLGLLERLEVHAILDWLEREKAPTWIGLLGRSMGGAAAANAAARDDRVRGLVLDSTHARLSNTIEARMRIAGYPLEPLGSLAVLAAAWVRSGELLSAADPIGTVDDLGDLPLLIVHGGEDREAPPENAEQLADAARSAGVEVETQICPDASHGAVLDTCPEEYRSWLLGFLARARER